MRLNEIPQPKIEGWMPRGTRNTMQTAPLSLAAIMPDLSPGQVKLLAGGENSASYYITAERPSIMKMNNHGIFAEIEALEAWRKQGVRVPQIYSSGFVPKNTAMMYMSQEPITNTDGTLAEVGWSVFHNNPTGLGKSMGEALARMHRASCEVPFGLLSDSQRTVYGSYSEYLTETLGQVNNGRLPAETVQKVQNIFRSGRIPFPNKGVYVHNDFGPHNVLIPNENISEMVVIDPGSPYCASGYWDIAARANVLEVQKARAELDPLNKRYANDLDRQRRYYKAFISGYVSESGEPIDDTQMAAHQLIRALRKLNYDSPRMQHIGMFTRIKTIVGLEKVDQRVIDLPFYDGLVRNLAQQIIELGK